MSCTITNQYDICILQNQTFELPITLYDDDGVSPINITGWSFTASIRQQYSDPTPLLSFTASVVSVPSASVMLYMPAEQTWELTGKKYVYDLISNNPSGTVYLPNGGSVVGIETLRLMQGKVSVNSGVTEP